MFNNQNILEYFNQLPTLLKIVWIGSVVLFILILFFLFYLYYLRTYLRSKELISKNLFTQYENDLITYLYLGENTSQINSEQQTIIDKMKVSIQNTFKRTILISVLSKLKSDISGEMALAINQLFIKTGLLNYALKKLESKKWDQIALGIKELTQFEITNVYNEISKFQNYPKQEVRNQVQLYYVSLFHFKGLEFLDNLKTPISEWNQIQLLEILQKFDDQEITDISPWLKSENDSVVLFALKLAKIYNQFQVIEILLQLLNHKNKEIRVSVIEILGYFQVKEAKEIVKSNFSDRSSEEKITFFKILQDIVTADDEAFIIENTLNPNFQIRFLAFQLLKKNHIKKLHELKQKATEFDNSRIFNFLEVV